MTMSQEVTSNPFADLLPPDHTAEGMWEFNADASRAAFIAFNQHLGVLADVVDVRPDIAHGDTTISIPAFFAHEDRPTNPLNDVALSLLEELGHGTLHNESPVRAETVLKHGVFQLPESDVTIARDGKSVEAFVVNKLDLASDAVKEGLDRTGPYSRLLHPKDVKERTRRTQQLLYGITQDFDAAVVGDVKDVYERVTRKGYRDFFDYLVDVRTVTTERVQALFTHPAL
jgi:hypothetical protein